MRRTHRARGIVGLVCLLALTACKSSRPKIPAAWELGGQTQAYHDGPLVVAGMSGSRGHAQGLIESWPAPDTTFHSFDPEKLGWQPWKVQSESFGWLWRASALPGRAEGEVEDQAGDQQSRVIVLQLEPETREHAGFWIAMQAWTNGIGTIQLDAPGCQVLVTWGDPKATRSALAESELLPLAWIVVSEREEGPCTLYRGPDPMAPLPAVKPDQEKAQGNALQAVAPTPTVAGNGLALLFRMACVDVGLECRPWKTVERPFDGDLAGQAIVRAGIPYVRLEAGVSGVDISASDRPKLIDRDREGLVVWSAVQAICAPNTSELERYLGSLQLEARLRSNQEGVELEAWKVWLTDARHWLRHLTLGA